MGQHPAKIGQYRDGLFRKAVQTVRVVSSGPTDVLPEQSGTLFYIPLATTHTMRLPRISSKWLGLEYTFFVAEQASSNDVKINCALDSSALIKMNYSSIVDEASTIIPGSTFATGLKVTAVSSIVWMGQPITANSYSMSSAATDNLSGWTTG